MPHKETFVKGQNLERGMTKRQFINNVTYGILAFASLELSAIADNRSFDSTQPSPIARKPTKLIDEVKPGQDASESKKDELIHIDEVLDPASDEAQCNYALEGLQFATEKERQKFKDRLLTHPSGALVYFSERTITHFADQNGHNNLQNVWDAIPSQYIPPFKTPPLPILISGKYCVSREFVIVDSQDLRGDVNIFVFHTFQTGQPQSPVYVYRDSLPFTEMIKYNRLRHFPRRTSSMLWKNGEPIQIKDCLRATTNQDSVTLKREISMVHDNPIWDETHNRLVLSNGLRTIGNYDTDDVKDPTAITNNQRYILPKPLETPYLCGSKQEVLNASLRETLLIAPELFTNCQEVINYLKTGDAAQLKYLKLVPEKDPSLFIVIGGKYGFEHKALIDGMVSAAEELYAIDPEMSNQLMTFGLWGVAADFTQDKYHMKKRVYTDMQATFDFLNGIMISNEYLQLTANHPNMDYAKGQTYSIMATLIFEGHHINQIRTDGMITDTGNSDGYRRAQGMKKGEFLKQFVIKNYQKLDPVARKNLLDEAQAQKDSYRKAGRPVL